MKRSLVFDDSFCSKYNIINYYILKYFVSSESEYFIRTIKSSHNFARVVFWLVCSVLNKFKLIFHVEFDSFYFSHANLFIRKFNLVLLEDFYNDNGHFTKVFPSERLIASVLFSIVPE